MEVEHKIKTFLLVVLLVLIPFPLSSGKAQVINLYKWIFFKKKILCVQLWIFYPNSSPLDQS
jgi:hypothetical protein